VRDRALDALIEEITVDAYGDEGSDAFACQFADAIGLPLSGLVIGEKVEVIDVFFEGDARRGLSARCRRTRQTHVVALLDLSFPRDSAESRASARVRPPRAQVCGDTEGQACANSEA